MNHPLRLAASALTLASLLTAAYAQTTANAEAPGSTKKTRTVKHHKPSVQEQLLQMQQQMQEQNAKLEAEIADLKAQLATRHSETDTLAQSAWAAQDKANHARCLGRNTGT